MGLLALWGRNFIYHKNYQLKMRSTCPSKVVLYCCNPLAAGPWETDPSVIKKLDPQQVSVAKIKVESTSTVPQGLSGSKVQCRSSATNCSWLSRYNNIPRLPPVMYSKPPGTATLIKEGSLTKILMSTGTRGIPEVVEFSLLHEEAVVNNRTNVKLNQEDNFITFVNVIRKFNECCASLSISS